MERDIKEGVDATSLQNDVNGSQSCHSILVNTAIFQNIWQCLIFVPVSFLSTVDCEQ